jgi:hypothetical protein
MTHEYAVMSPDLKGYTLTGGYREVTEFYEKYKQSIISSGSGLYKYVLVKQKHKLYGYSLNIGIDFTALKYRLKPKCRYRSFEWLIFKIDLTQIRYFTPDKIIKDHWKESQAVNI